jgi:hypothetical protein
VKWDLSFEVLRKLYASYIYSVVRKNGSMLLSKRMCCLSTGVSVEHLVLRLNQGLAVQEQILDC